MFSMRMKTNDNFLSNRYVSKLNTLKRKDREEHQG